MGVFDVFQIPYSAVEREHEVITSAASEAWAGIVIRGGAAKGAPEEKQRRLLRAAGQTPGPTRRYDTNGIRPAFCLH
jgi:hypothetical protein